MYKFHKLMMHMLTVVEFQTLMKQHKLIFFNIEQTFLKII